LRRYANIEQEFRNYVKSSRRQKKAKIFNDWMSEIRARRVIIKFRKNSEKLNKQRCLAALHDFVAYARDKAIKLHDGLCNRNYYLAKRCLEMIFMFAHD
jgi:hypothetical protein